MTDTPGAASATRSSVRGFRAAHVDGETPRKERKRLIAGLGTGGVQVLATSAAAAHWSNSPGSAR